jgi:hypothetical protein
MCASQQEPDAGFGHLSPRESLEDGKKQLVIMFDNGSDKGSAAGGGEITSECVGCRSRAEIIK